jgi:hypothetical protein
VCVRELEAGGINFATLKRKYGIRGGGTVQCWLSRYGNGNLGKLIRVEKAGELSEKVELKRRVRALEKALADANIDLALERAYTKIACKRAGIEDVAEFKKKAAGRLPT